MNKVYKDKQDDMMKTFQPKEILTMRSKIPTKLYKGIMQNDDYSIMISENEIRIYNNRTYQDIRIKISEFYSNMRTIDKLKLAILKLSLSMNIDINLNKLNKIVDVNMSDETMFATRVDYDSINNKKIVEKLKIAEEQLQPVKHTIPTYLDLSEIAIQDKRNYGYEYSSFVEFHKFSGEVFFIVRETLTGKIVTQDKLTK